MKKTTRFLLSSLLLLGLACQKKQSSGETTLSGTWKYVAYYFSLGGPGMWNQADPQGQTITFGSNGNFSQTGTIFNTFNQFQEIDSVTIRFTPSTAPNGYSEFLYQIDASGDVLNLSPSNPACIEGCSFRFERVFIR